MQTRTPDVAARTSRHSPALDGLRGLCITAVLLYHLDPAGRFEGGYLGVSVFFTLSGFLITRNLIEELQTTGRVDVIRFWAKRVQRLAPAALAATLLVIVMTRLSERGWSAHDISRHAIATTWSAMNWNIIDIGRTNVLSLLGPLGPMWSLAVEEQFYVIIAFVFAILRGPHAIRNLTVLLACVCVGSVVVAAMLGGYEPRLEFGTDTRAAELAIGALLAVLVDRRPDVLTSSVVAKRWAGLVALGVLCALFLGGWSARSWLLDGWLCAVALLSATVIVALLTGGPMAAAAAWSPVVWLGRISYSLYLVHWPIILITHDPFLGQSGLVAQALRVLLCLGAAIALHVLVERPVRRVSSAPGRTLGWWAVSSVAVTVVAVLVV